MQSSLLDMGGRDITTGFQGLCDIEIRIISWLWSAGPLIWYIVVRTGILIEKKAGKRRGGRDRSSVCWFTFPVVSTAGVAQVARILGLHVVSNMGVGPSASRSLDQMQRSWGAKMSFTWDADIAGGGSTWLCHSTGPLLYSLIYSLWDFFGVLYILSSHTCFIYFPKVKSST